MGFDIGELFEIALLSVLKLKGIERELGFVKRFLLKPFTEYVVVSERQISSICDLIKVDYKQEREIAVVDQCKETKSNIKFLTLGPKSSG